MNNDDESWEVSQNGRNIFGSDFLHDVTLRVSGDFENDEIRKRYSDNLATKLNAPIKTMAAKIRRLESIIECLVSIREERAAELTSYSATTLTIGDVLKAAEDRRKALEAKERKAYSDAAAVLTERTTK